MKNLIIILILAVIVGAILVYLYKAAKKRGESCIGCPYAKQCASKGKCDHREKDRNQ